MKPIVAGIPVSESRKIHGLGMTGGSVGLGRRVGLVAAFIVSFAAAALLSSHVLSSRVLARGQPMPPRPAYAGAPLAALPSAFDIHRLVPLSDPAADTRWAPVLRASVARDEPSSKAAPVGQLPTITPDGTTNIVVADGEADVDGATWVRVGLAVLPNDTEGWVPRSSLGVVVRRYATRHRPSPIHGDAVQRRSRHLSHASRRGGSGHTHARRPVLRARPPERLLQPHLWTARIRYQRALPDAYRLARRRRCGNPRDQPTCPDSRADSHGCVRLTNAAILKLGSSWRSALR